jgi:hypothetical protein
MAKRGGWSAVKEIGKQYSPDLRVVWLNRAQAVGERDRRRDLVARDDPGAGVALACLK